MARPKVRTAEELAQSNRDRQKKFNEAHERLECKVEKGTKARITALGYKSYLSFVYQAVFEKLEREENK